MITIFKKKSIDWRRKRVGMGTYSIPKSYNSIQSYARGRSDFRNAVIFYSDLQCQISIN